MNNEPLRGLLKDSPNAKKPTCNKLFVDSSYAAQLREGVNPSSLKTCDDCVQ